MAYTVSDKGSRGRGSSPYQRVRRRDETESARPHDHNNFPWDENDSISGRRNQLALTRLRSENSSTTGRRSEHDSPRTRSPSRGARIHFQDELDGLREDLRRDRQPYDRQRVELWPNEVEKDTTGRVPQPRHININIDIGREDVQTLPTDLEPSPSLSRRVGRASYDRSQMEVPLDQGAMLSNQPPDEIVDMEFERLMVKQGWDELSLYTQSYMKRYPAEKKWVMICENSRTTGFQRPSVQYGGGAVPREYHRSSVDSGVRYSPQLEPYSRTVEYRYPIDSYETTRYENTSSRDVTPRPGFRRPEYDDYRASGYEESRKLGYVELRRQYDELKRQYDELKKRLYEDHEGPEFDDVRRRYEELKRRHDELPKPEKHRNYEEPQSHPKDSPTPKIALHSPEYPRDDRGEQEDAQFSSRLDRQEKELGLVRSFLEEDLKRIAHAQSQKMEESHLQTQKRLDEMREDIRLIMTQTAALSTQVGKGSPEPVNEGSTRQSESDQDETPTRFVESTPRAYQRPFSRDLEEEALDEWPFPKEDVQRSVSLGSAVSNQEIEPAAPTELPVIEETFSIPEDMSGDDDDEVSSDSQEDALDLVLELHEDAIAGAEIGSKPTTNEPYVLTDREENLDTAWEGVRDSLPESWRLDLEYSKIHEDLGRGTWTCRPMDPDKVVDYPLRVAGAPVVIPIQARWPALAGVAEPPDPRATKLIDCRADLPLDVIQEIFLTFKDCLGVFVLINGLLQIVVDEYFDIEWAVSHYPHRFGGLKVSYVRDTREPTMKPAKSSSSRRGPRLHRQDTKASRRSTLSQNAQPPLLQLNDKIEARAAHSIRKTHGYVGRIGLQVTKDNQPYLIMATHVITQAMIHKDRISARLGRGPKELPADWKEKVEIWAANEKFGTLGPSFDPHPAAYPNGFKHDVTLIKPLHSSMTKQIVSPIRGLGWLNHKSWSSLCQHTSSIRFLALGDLERSAKTLETSLPSKIETVGRGIFRNQEPHDHKSDREIKLAAWKDMISIAVLYRVDPKFDPPYGYSGVAIIADGIREDDTEGPGIAGFQSFVQHSDVNQVYKQDGGALNELLEKGLVAFYGAFEVPEQLRKEYTIM